MAYNKIKAHEYYMKHRKLKGKKPKGNVVGSNFGTGSAFGKPKIGFKSITGPGVTSIGSKSPSVSSIGTKSVSVSSINKKKPKPSSKKTSSKKKRK